MSKIKNLLLAAVFVIIIFGMGVTHFLLPDAELSKAERRKLAQAPEFTADGVMSGEYMTELEDYMLDQFPLRDKFRELKARLKFEVFRQADNNGIWVKDDSVFKIEDKLDEKQVVYAAGKLNNIVEKYAQGMNVYYAVIPDKNYFAAEGNGYPSLDYDRLLSLMAENVKGMEYIDLFGVLSIEDYYRTDSHWSQERLDPVISALGTALDIPVASTEEYEQHVLEPFYGVFMGQSALPVKPDKITYLTSETTENAVVTGAEFQGERPVYTLDRFTGMDGYDIFLSGAQAVLTVQSPNAKTDRELILFRDSFGSSIAPLLLESYSKITLVDLRYIASDFVGNFVEFTEEADVLFLYSTSLLNSGMLLK